MAALRVILLACVLTVCCRGKAVCDCLCCGTEDPHGSCEPVLQGSVDVGCCTECDTSMCGLHGLYRNCTGSMLLFESFECQAGGDHGKRCLVTSDEKTCNDSFWAYNVPLCSVGACSRVHPFTADHTAVRWLGMDLAAQAIKIASYADAQCSGPVEKVYLLRSGECAPLPTETHTYWISCEF